MKPKVSNNRVVIALCMDKERDERLINYLNSKVNKSDYIRSILNEKLNEEDNPSVVHDNFVMNTLLEVLNNLSSLTDKLISVSNNGFPYNCSQGSKQVLSSHNGSNKTDDFSHMQRSSLQQTSCENIINENAITENLINISDTTTETSDASNTILDSILGAIAEFKC